MAWIEKRTGYRDNKPRYVVRWRPFKGSPREKARTFPTKALAEAFVDQIRTGGSPGDDRPFSDALDRWQDSRAGRGLKANTLDLEARMIRLHVLPRWGSVKLGHIRRADLKEWLAELFETHSVQTVKTIWRLTRGPLNYAADDLEWIARSPAQGLSLAAIAPREPRPPARHLEPWEVERLAAEAGYYRPLIRFMYASGLRVGEALALRVGDFTGDAVKVSKTVRVVAGKRTEGTPKTPKARRTVALDSDTCSMLAEVAGDRPASAHLFVGPRGAPLHPSNFRRKVFLRALERAGLAHASPHSLRHGHAALLLSNGAPLQAVSERLGHASVNITGQTYGHLLAHVDRSIADSFAEWSSSSADHMRTAGAVVPLKPA